MKPFCSDSKVKKSDAFIGFQKDTPASVIFEATNQLKSVRAAALRWSGYVMGQSADFMEWSQCDPRELEEEDSWGKAVS